MNITLATSGVFADFLNPSKLGGWGGDAVRPSLHCFFAFYLKYLDLANLFVADASMKIIRNKKI